MYIKSLAQKKSDLNKNIDFDHMVYVRIFEGCNLHCEHCFIPPNPKKIEPSYFMDNKITDSLISNSNIKIGSLLYIQWHGGEPTIFGPKYLRNCLENIEADSRFNYKHGIQTNLLNFSDNPTEWCELYKTHFNNSIGVSWDPEIRHIKSSEDPVTTNLNYEKKFWNNVRLASDLGLDLYFVVTATKTFFNLFANPFDFFELMVNNNIRNINLERITNTGLARSSWEKLGLTNYEYSVFMSKFFKYYLLFKESNPSIELNISPFDGLLNSVIKLNLSKSFKDSAENLDISGYGCWSGKCDTKFHTIDANGYKHGCTALTSEEDNLNKTLAGSLKGKKIIWIGSEKITQREKILEERSNRKKSCIDCNFTTICSSGCLSVEKWDESNECSGGSILFETINNLVNKELRL